MSRESIEDKVAALAPAEAGDYARLAGLVSRVGEVAETVHVKEFHGEPLIEELRDALGEVAAEALAWIQHIDGRHAAAES